MEPGVPCFAAGDGNPSTTRGSAVPGPHMNVLTVGFDKSPLLDYVEPPFLIIDDGDLIDRIVLPKRRKVTVLDLSKHRLNPLKDIDYRRAREFVQVLNATFPEGESTLTRRNSNYQLLCALLEKPKLLSDLISDTKDTRDAYQQIQTLLMSPVLEPVLNRPTNLSLKGTIFARLNRAELGDFDCFVLGNLLVSNYPGTVIIPDFGFYACGFHTRLMRQERLVAGINSFAEVPKLRNHLMLMERKIGSHCTPEDAHTLAIYAGIIENTMRYHDFIERNITPMRRLDSPKE